MRHSLAGTPNERASGARIASVVRWAVAAACLAVALAGCPTPPGPGDAGGTGDVPGGLDEGVGDHGGAWDLDSGPPDAQPLASLGACESDGACQALVEAQGVAASGSCLRFQCLEGACVEAPLDDGAACDVGLCVGAGTCAAGVCAEAPSPCDDGNPCTTDQCDPTSGCVHTFNQLPCDDGDACTTGDACAVGVCRGEAVVCDDGEDCTEDACDPTTGACSFSARTGACDDGDACTAGGACAGGKCQPGEPVTCDDGEACTEEHCEADVGCVTTLLTGPCDDGNACTTDTNCSEGKCLGTLITCDDGELCTSDYCDPSAGCVFAPNVLPCDDGDPCTLGDQCDGGACVPGSPDPLCCAADGECDDQDLCTTDACLDGYCTFTPLDCDDGAVCTVDTCEAGVCAHEPLGAWGSGPLWTDGFEDPGLTGWTITSDNADVTWQRDPARAHGGGASLYCGNLASQTYDFGKTRAEAARGVMLPAVSDLTLRLWAWVDVTEPSCSYDFVTVTVDGEALEPPLCETTDDWVEVTFDLAAWAGQAVTLGLVFDTTDEIANDGQGIWIDDVAVEGQAPSGCCAQDEDCQGGLGCLAEVCLPATWACGVLDAADACQDDDPCTDDLCDDLGDCQHPPSGACCTDAASCPDDPAKPCAVPTCAADGSCGLDLSACCADAADCPDDPTKACATPTCGPDGSCGLDESLCCSGDAATCPPHPQGACAVASCSAEGSCEYDTSGCPAGG